MIWLATRNFTAGSLRVYLTLKSFAAAKLKPGKVLSVTVTHRQIAQRSNLSHKTIVKALLELEKAGWIEQMANSGAANQYIFTTEI